MLVEIGYIAIGISFALSTYISIASLVGGIKKIPELIVSARWGLYSLPFLLFVAVIALVNAFVTNDFSVRYVAENSNLAMPEQYTWVALYAGNAGSLLFIAIVFSLLAVAAILSIRKSLPHSTPYALALMALVLTFFLGIICFMANPLERLPITPADGQGINPLLVHFGMFIHPPVQMTGLVSVTIPFSIAIGAMLAKRGGRDEWVDIGRIWGMISWLILTMGLLLGSWWAYTILGWGGYWAWDPVENSALMPWLAMTAFIHSIMVQKRRGMFRMWNMVIIIVAFTLSLMGMFINRGGPVPSVHSFAQSTMGWLFLMFMGVSLFGSLIAFLLRMDNLISRDKLESLLSRESMFLFQNVLFLIAAFITLWGSVFPVLAKVINGTTVTVGEPFYNVVVGPILLVILIVMGIGPFFPWRRATKSNIYRAIRVPLAAGILTAIIIIAIGIRQPLATLAFAVCGVAAAGIFNEWFRGTRTRMRKGEPVWIAFTNLITRNRPRYGGYIVHLGILMLAIGAIASSFYSTQQDITMQPGETYEIGDYTLSYLDSYQRKYSDRDEFIGEFKVTKGNKDLGLMYPKQSFYREFRINATHAAIKSNPIEDFYIIPSEFSDNGEAIFRILLNPLVWWMWAAGPVMAIGTIFALTPQKRISVKLISKEEDKKRDL